MSMQCAMTLQKDHNHRILAIHRWHRVRHADITCHMHTSHAHISDQLYNNCFACMVCAPHPSSHYQTPAQPTPMVQRHHTDAPQHDLLSDTRISHCESDCFASSHWYMHREACHRNDALSGSSAPLGARGTATVADKSDAPLHPELPQPSLLSGPAAAAPPIVLYVLIWLISTFILYYIGTVLYSVELR